MTLCFEVECCKIAGIISFEARHFICFRVSGTYSGKEQKVANFSGMWVQTYWFWGEICINFSVDIGVGLQY